MLKGIKFLINYCWKFDKIYIISLFTKQIIDSIFPLVSVIIPKFIIDELVGDKDINLVSKYIILLICTYLICSIASNILSNLIFVHKTKVFNEFQIYLGDLIASADYDQLEDSQFLNLKEKAYKFLYANGSGFAQTLENSVAILSKLIVFIGLIGIISTFDSYMVILFLILVLISVFVDSKIKKKNIKLQLEKVLCERQGQYFSNLLSDFSFGKEIRINNLKDWIINKYKVQLKINENFYRKISKNNMISVNFNTLVIFIQQILLYTYLIYKIIKNAISIGDFSMYLQTVSKFSTLLRDLINQLIDIQQYGIYYNEFEEYINVKQNLRKGYLKPEFCDENYTIEFRNVYFKYKNQKNYALKDVSITISSNEKLAIVGENGAGKTTFVKLLSRLYDPTEGEILLNGINIKEIDYDYYMNILSVIYQDFKLFSFTLKENICLDKSDTITDDYLDKVLINSGLKNRVNLLPDGVNTHIYKTFNNISFEPSGGEGQKIALSRALCKKSKIIILDEPTSALDPRAEYNMYKQFDELAKNKTTIYISHRLSSTKFCDKVAVFSNGEIIEYGSHNELMMNESNYSELYSMQAEFYN